MPKLGCCHSPRYIKKGYIYILYIDPFYISWAAAERRLKKRGRRKKKEKKGENSRYYWSNVGDLRLTILVMK